MIFVGKTLKVPGADVESAPASASTGGESEPTSAPVAAAGGQTLTFDKPLENDHPVGDIVTVEFVRQRFWADADVGSVFCHDHAFGGTTWPHGAVCTFLIEPFGSTWHDPKTGKAHSYRASCRYSYH